MSSVVACHPPPPILAQTHLITWSSLSTISLPALDTTGPSLLLTPHHHHLVLNVSFSLSLCLYWSHFSFLFISILCLPCFQLYNLIHFKFSVQCFKFRNLMKENKYSMTQICGIYCTETHLPNSLAVLHRQDYWFPPPLSLHPSAFNPIQAAMGRRK